MTVTIDARYLKRPGIGISVYLAALVDTVVGTGARLTLLTDDEEHAGQLRAQWPDVAVTALPARSGFLWEQVLLPRHLRRAAPRVHVAGANYGLPLRRVRPTRLVQMVHDLIPLRMPRTYLVPRPAWAAKYLLSTAISLARADLLVAASHSTADDVRRWSRRHEHVAVRYPPPLRPATATAVDAALPEGWPARYLLYNGGLDARKNVGELLEAFRLHRERGGDHDLVLMGAGYERLLPLARSLGVEAHLRLPGYVDEPTKLAAIRGAAAIVYPSRSEGFGLPVVEGLSLGTPVVSGTGGSLREVGGDAVVFVDVADPASIADGIERALRPEERERLRALAPRQLGRLVTSAQDDPLVAFLHAAV